MSGSYRIERFYDGAWSQALCFSAPLQFLPGLDGPQLDRLRLRRVVLASGEGDWEDIGESWRMAAALGAKAIPNRGGQLGPAMGAQLGHVAPDAAAAPPRAHLPRARRQRTRRVQA